MIDRPHHVSLDELIDIPPSPPGREMGLVNVLMKFPLTMRLYHRFLRRFFPLRSATTYFGAVIPVDIRDFIQSTLYYFGVWEPNESRLLAAWLREGDVVVDLGANVGYYSMLFAQCVGPRGKVIAIEAHPYFAELARANVITNGFDNVRVINCAATKVSGQVTLFQGPKSNWGATTLDESRGFQEFKTVVGKPIMDILSSDDLSDITLIKIDIEGAEGPVVQDIIKNLDRFPKRFAIAVEANIGEDQEWRSMFRQLLNSDFRVFEIIRDYRWATFRSPANLRLPEIRVVPNAVCDLFIVRGLEFEVEG